MLVQFFSNTEHFSSTKLNKCECYVRHGSPVGALNSTDVPVLCTVAYISHCRVLTVQLSRFTARK
jgi:hypothetical protein